MRVRQETAVRQSRQAGKVPPEKTEFDTVSPRKTSYLIRKVHHLWDKAHLSLKTKQ